MGVRHGSRQSNSRALKTRLLPFPNVSIVLPSIAVDPIAVGIMSPEALIASNFDINTDNLQNENDVHLYESQTKSNDLTWQVECYASFVSRREPDHQCACRFRPGSRLPHRVQELWGRCTRPRCNAGTDLE